MVKKLLIVIILVTLAALVVADSTGTFVNPQNMWVVGYQLGYSTLEESESFAATVSFIGSASSDVYHYPWCFHVDRIKERRRVRFSTAAVAEAQGYHPCSICHPPQ